MLLLDVGAYDMHASELNISVKHECDLPSADNGSDRLGQDH